MKLRTIGAGVIVLLLTLLLASTASANPSACVKIQDGTLDYSAGHYLQAEGLTIGYDVFGYNYQAHMFNGTYANTYLGRDGFPPYEGDDAAYAQRLVDESISGDPTVKWYWPYRDVELMMQWNEAWLSNKDCGTQVNQGAFTDLETPDGKLDRHYPDDAYIGSGAWLTNHMSGDDDGEHWTYFTKIVAAPADAVPTAGIWYDAEGTEIGPVIWGSFATIQDVESGEGATYVSPSGPAFGKWD